MHSGHFDALIRHVANVGAEIGHAAAHVGANSAAVNGGTLFALTSPVRMLQRCAACLARAAARGMWRPGRDE